MDHMFQQYLTFSSLSAMAITLMPDLKWSQPTIIEGNARRVCLIDNKGAAWVMPSGAETHPFMVGEWWVSDITFYNTSFQRLRPVRSITEITS